MTGARSSAHRQYALRKKALTAIDAGVIVCWSAASGALGADMAARAHHLWTRFGDAGALANAAGSSGCFF